MRPTGLDDPEYAAYAWARFRNLLAWMTAAGGACAAAALVALNYSFGPLNLITSLATVFGVGLSVMLAGALMGLVFLSSGSGHDETIDDLE
jgi:hypothetical protein